MLLKLDLDSIEDYRKFLAIKSLPVYRFQGRTAWFPDEYAGRLGVAIERKHDVEYEPIAGLFDYQRDIARLAIKRRKFAAFVECVAGDTIVSGPNGDTQIADLVGRSDPVMVWARNRYGKAVAAEATASWVGGVDKLYRVSLASGRTIEATRRHRVLTSSGWTYVGSLTIGECLAVSSLFQTRTNSGSCLQEFPSNDPCSTRKVAGYPASCSGDCRRCGEQLLEEAAISQVSSPLQDGVLSRSFQRSLLGGLETKSTHSHHHRWSSRLSMNRSCFQAETTGEASQSLPPSFDSASSASSNRSDYSVRGGMRLCSPVHEPLPLEGRSSSVFPCTCSYWDQVVSIEYTRKDEFYDIHVPGYENYLSNGIWSHNCGYGKTLIGLEFARHVQGVLSGKKKTMIVTPLMVVEQMIAEAGRFYGDALPVEQVKASNIKAWLKTPGDAVGVTNYDALKDDLDQGLLGCLVIDESSSLKDFTGKHAQQIIQLGKGLDWKLCMTGTPAPNDRIEFANHAVFLDAFPTINSFLAKFFINRGQTQERWEMKPHAIGAFYRALSHWSIFMSNPATYGWKDNCGTIPPIQVHIHDVDMTDEQQAIFRGETGTLFASDLGGIATRATMGQLAKGKFKGRAVATNKPEFIRDLVASWPDESTLIWCIYDDEQRIMERMFPAAASISGPTPHAKRMELIGQFQRGERKVLISKGKVLGYGLNLQVATRHVFSGLQDSFETYWQCVKRSNRVGSTMPLNVHIPTTDVERPMIDTVLRKAHRIEEDTRIQEELFKEMSIVAA